LDREERTFDGPVLLHEFRISKRRANRRPYLEPRNDERRGTEDHAKRGARQLLPRRKPRELYLQEFEVVGDGEEVTAGLIA
jgi:hypothetical protein